MKTKILETNGLSFDLHLCKLTDNNSKNISRYKICDSDNDLPEHYSDIHIKNRIITAKNIDHSLGMLAIVPSLKCNGSCEYCYAESTISKNTIVDKAKMFDTLERNYGTNFKSLFHEITVYGGEPLLYIDNLISILEEFNVSQITIVTGLLFTNSHFLNIIKKIKKSKISKVITFCLSIDPPPINKNFELYTRKYSRLSGEKLYKKLVHMAAYLSIEFKNRVFIRPTITNNCLDFETLALDIANASRTSIDDIFMSIEVEDKSSLSEHNILLLNEMMIRWIDSGKMLLNNVERFIPTFNNGIVDIFSYTGDCDFLLNSVTIDANGNLSPCPSVAAGAYIDEVPTGIYNIYKKRITNIWDKCKECEVLNYCGGFCWITEPSDARCEWRKISIYEAIYQTLKNIDINKLIKFGKQSD